MSTTNAGRPYNFECANCGQVSDSDLRPAGWQRYSGSRGPWWCGGCIVKLIDGVLDALKHVPSSR